MNDTFNSYMRSISSSQRIMQDMLLILNRQETTLSNIMNSETQDELRNLRRENEELTRTVRTLRQRNRESREPLPRNSINIRRETQPIIPPLWNQGQINNRNRTVFNTPRNRISNNHETFMRTVNLRIANALGF